MNNSNNNQEDEQEAHETNPTETRTETRNRSSKGSSIPNWYIAILGTVVAIYLSNIILMNLSRTAG